MHLDVVDQIVQMHRKLFSSWGSHNSSVENLMGTLSSSLCQLLNKEHITNGYLLFVMGALIL